MLGKLLFSGTYYFLSFKTYNLRILIVLYYPSFKNCVVQYNFLSHIYD